MPDVNASTLGDHIKEIIDRNGWSIRQSALQIGVSPAYLSKIINKKADSNPKSQTLSKLAKGLNVPESELMSIAGYMPVPKNVKATPTQDGAIITADMGFERSTHKLDVFGRIPAGTPTFACEDIIGQTVIPDELIQDYGLENLFGLQVNGDSMSRVIAPNFIAVFAKETHVETGDITAVLIDGDDATLKRFRETSRAIIFEPDSFNPVYKPIIFPKTGEQNFRILGKYVFATSLLN